jgi:type IV pilus assembly protein PilM
LSRSGDGYKVEAYRVLPLPPNTVIEKNIADIDALAEAIQTTVKRSGTKLKDTVVAVSDSSVITKEIELPAGLTDLQMEMQIEAEADQYIPFLGRPFRNDLRNVEKREILIFITPKIIDDNLLDR